MMNISVIGTGYVGLPLALTFARHGHNVMCCDKDEQKIERLKSGEPTIYEDKMDVRFLEAKKNITFTTSIFDAVEFADIIYLTVGTPETQFGGADLSFVYDAGNDMASVINSIDGDKYKVIAVKSTVPVGTNEKLENLIRDGIDNKYKKQNLDVVSIPEFMREGKAFDDLENPDRIIIGCESERAKALLMELYKDRLHKVFFMSRKSAELVKYASNSFLAMKIQYINDIAQLCDKCGADVSQVSLGMGLDTRIGKTFLNPGPGYGGSCFPKDTKALLDIAMNYELALPLVEKTVESNEMIPWKIALYAVDASTYRGSLTDIKIAVLGLTFKAGTDDCRESPAVKVVREILESMLSDYVAEVSVYDPIVTPERANKAFDGNSKISYATSSKEAYSGAQCVLVMTEWDEFRNIDAKLLPNNAHVFDYRNIVENGDEIIKHGCAFYAIGHGMRGEKDGKE